MEKKGSSSIVIEVTVISAEGLMISRNQPVKKNAFVVVRSDPFNSSSTGMNREGGGYPAWNEKLVVELPGTARFLTVEAHSGTKHIGKANIPVSDFVGGFLPLNYLSFLSYRLRDANGIKNGIVNLSVRVKSASAAIGGAAACAATFPGIPLVDGRNYIASDHRIVTGIPVSSYRY